MTTDDEGVLLVSLDDGVATVTLNRPDRGNGLTTELKERLLDALGNVGDDPAVRAVVLTGSGRSFCVGQDLGEHAEALRSDASTAFETVKRHYNPIVALLAGMPKPVIAAINGACVGAGLGFALACDLRIAADTAKFATAFTAIGLTCDSGLSATLALAVGAAEPASSCCSARRSVPRRRWRGASSVASFQPRSCPLPRRRRPDDSPRGRRRRTPRPNERSLRRACPP